MLAQGSKLLSSIDRSRRKIESCYEFVDEIGVGSFSTVCRWKHRLTGTDRAVKWIRWDRNWGKIDPYQIEILTTELYVLMSIDHPYIAKFVEFFEDSWAGMYFVTELCEGGSLEDMLDTVTSLSSLEERTRYTTRFQHIFWQITYAVAYLHKLSIMHRDVKPDNVLLKSIDDNSAAKLIDFGLSKVEPYEDEPMLVGTLEFIAPEIFLGEPHTTKCDLWSLGVIFAYMITAVEHGELIHPILRTVPDRETMDHEDLLEELSLLFNSTSPSWDEMFEGKSSSIRRVAGRVFQSCPTRRTGAAELLVEEWVAAGGDKLTDMSQGSCALDNIKSWTTLSQFEQELCSAVAQLASDAQVQDPLRIFNALDTSGDGMLSRQDIIKGCEIIGVYLSEKELDGLLRAVGQCKSRSLGYTEWLAATLERSLLNSEELVNLLFKSLDDNNTGYINVDYPPKCKTDANQQNDTIK